MTRHRVTIWEGFTTRGSKSIPHRVVLEYDTDERSGQRAEWVWVEFCQRDAMDQPSWRIEEDQGEVAEAIALAMRSVFVR